MTEQARPCPLCGGAGRGLAFPYENRWQGVVYHQLACSRCTASFVDPLPGDVTLRAIYDWDGYHACHYVDRYDGRHERALECLSSLRPDPGLLLDFGCGAGAFMEFAVARGWSATGVEYAASTITATAQRTGLPVLSLEEVERSSERFDVIYVSDVLPHVPDPASTCKRLVALLKPGGSLLLSGPIDAQASLVEWTARALKRLRRALGRDTIAERPPTMLVRTTRRAELRFFSECLGLRVDRFTVYETGWPYRTSQRAHGAGAAVRHAIGTLAIGLARVTPGQRLGNRFLAVLSEK